MIDTRKIHLIIEKFTIKISDLVEDVGQTEFIKGYTDAPVFSSEAGISFDLLQEKAAEFAAAYKTPFLNDLQETDKGRVFTILDEMLKEGATFEEFAKRIEKTGLFGETRARKIFRTEINRFNNYGALERYKDSKVPFKQLMLGRNPCPHCKETYDKGYIVPVDQPFPNGFMAPPFHPQCTCGMAPRYDLPDDYILPAEREDYGDKSK